MARYNKLSKELQKRIEAEISDRHIFDKAIRRDANHDAFVLWRPDFVRDTEKIMHSPFYNRYSDKTQVFSFDRNTDITHRSLHVQLVSRIARNIGRMLGLNLDLIEAISLGHDIGHTPFGHAGEKYLNKQYYAHTGRYFNHNVHSVRVLDGIFHYNISLQTLDGILCHNGEFAMQEYRPCELSSFDEFDKKVENCYTNKDYISTLIPSTLEGCVVRISDMIAYIGKDRQDAIRTGVIESHDIFEDSSMGTYNAQMINNLIVNIVENSYGKDYIKLDDDYYRSMKNSKNENYKYIYETEGVSKKVGNIIEPMFENMYNRLLKDLTEGNENSFIFRHHIDFISSWHKYYKGEPYTETEPNQIVTDYIAGMTDDYFVGLYNHMFPDSVHITYKSGFEE